MFTFFWECQIVLCERVQFLRVSVNSGNAMLGSPAGVILPAKKKAQTPSSFPLCSIPNPHNPWLTQPFCVFYPVGDFTSFLNPCLPFLLPPSHFPPWVLSQAWLQASRTIHQQQQQLPQWRPPNPSTHSTSASKSPLEFTSLKFSCQLDHLDCVHLSFKSSLAGWPDQCASACLGIVNINIKAKGFICSDCNCEKMWWNLSQGGCEHQISWHWTLKVQHWANIFLARLALRLMD